MVTLLLNWGANIHAQDDQALISASSYGRLSVVEELLRRGANVHAQNEKALKQAILNNRQTVIQKLFDNGANINVLSPELQRDYRYMVAKHIHLGEYYRLESLLDNIRIFPDRYLLYSKFGEIYSLLR